MKGAQAGSRAPRPSGGGLSARWREARPAAREGEGLTPARAAFAGALALLLAACAAAPEQDGGWRAAHQAGEAAREQVRFAEAPLPNVWTPVAVTSTPAPLNAPAIEAGEGPLVFRGGLELTSPFDRFHGLSDLKFVDETRFYAVTDEGLLLRGAVELAEGRLVAVRDLAVRPLTDLDGAPLLAKAAADAEGLAILPDGLLLVSFEHEHRVWRYHPELGRMLGALPIPDFPFAANDGLEGIAAWGRDGYWAAGENGGLWRCAPTGCAVVAEPPAVPPLDAELRVVSLDRDPDGAGLFTLRRAFDSATGRTTIELARTRNGPAAPADEILLTLTNPMTVDNFEGVAAVRRADGGVRLYILSDDNFSPRQRTLLLAFDVR